MNNLIKFSFGFFLYITWSGCAPAQGDHPGHEYMPDMMHSTAFEANLYNYYKFNTWGTKQEYKDLAVPRTPVDGTVPRGYTSFSYGSDFYPSSATMVNVNGAVPYHYENTEDDRLRAMEEITANPFPITEEGLAKGENLFTIYCAVCHGNNADGTGYIVREDGGLYPAQPTNLLLDEFVTASEGRYYHTIMYGRNVMGSHADKLSFEERWQVIHYIRFLQARNSGLVYSPSDNTLNKSAIPASMYKGDQLESLISGDHPDMSEEGAGHQ